VSLSIPNGTSAATVNLPIPQTLQLTAKPQDATGRDLFRDVTWTSSAPTVATVSSTGLVTTVAIGTATITATSEGKTGTSTITVVPPPAVSTVTLSLTSGFMPSTVGVPLTATLRDAAGGLLVNRVVTWSSSNDALATVSATGVVTGAGFGSVTITATSEGRTGTGTFSTIPGLRSGVGLTFSNSSTNLAQFAVYVPPGSTSLVLTLRNGTGDPDLYIYRPGNTNINADDAHSFNDGPTENITVTNPAAGVWWVLVDPFLPHTGTVITATVTPTPP
jgi:hypothetical protein